MGRRAMGESVFVKNRVREFREKLGLTQTQLSEISGVSNSRLSRIELAKRPVRLDDLKALAPFLATTVLSLQRDTDTGEGGDKVESIEVSSTVQAGLWSKSFEWPTNERYELKLPKMAAYPDVARKGSVVKGDGMNRVYPDGSVIVWVPFGEIGEPLMPGRHYVLNRHGIDGAIEHSVRTFARDREGREWMMPESDNSDYKPIPIDGSAKEYTVEIVGRIITSIGARAGL